MPMPTGKDRHADANMDDAGEEAVADNEPGSNDEKKEGVM